MKTHYIVSLVWVASFVLLGCKTTVQSKVTTFHQLPQRFDGQTFVIYPADIKQAGRQEFLSYARQIGEKLEKRGLKLLGDEKSEVPTYAVLVAYGIDNGRTMSYSIPQYGLSGGGYTKFSGTVSSGSKSSTYSGTAHTEPEFGQTGSALVSGTEYKRLLFVDIHDGQEFKAGKSKILFEGRLRSVGASGHLPEIMPKLIAAMFDDFPGKSGATRAITK